MTGGPVNKGQVRQTNRRSQEEKMERNNLSFQSTESDDAWPSSKSSVPGGELARREMSHASM